MGRTGQVRRGMHPTTMLVLVVLLTVAVLAAIFGVDAFSKQWKLESACDDASSVAAHAGTTDPFALQTAVNNYTLGLKNMNGFKAVASFVNGTEQVKVVCTRNVKPTLSGLFQFKHGIDQKAHSTTTRVLG